MLTLTAILGQYFNTESYKYNETSKIVLISYSRIVLQLCWDFFLDEVLTIKDIVGFCIIVTTLTVSKIKEKKN